MGAPQKVYGDNHPTVSQLAKDTGLKYSLFCDYANFGLEVQLPRWLWEEMAARGAEFPELDMGKASLHIIQTQAHCSTSLWLHDHQEVYPCLLQAPCHGRVTGSHGIQL